MKIEIISRRVASIEADPFGDDGDTFTTYRYDLAVDGQPIAMTTCLDPDSPGFRREAKARAIQERARTASAEERVELGKQLDEALGYHGFLWPDGNETKGNDGDSAGRITVGEDGAAECSIHGHASTRILDTSETGSALIGCRACDAAPRWVGV